MFNRNLNRHVIPISVDIENKILNEQTKKCKKNHIKNKLSFNQTRTYYIVREVKFLEIKPIEPLTQLMGFTIKNAL